MIKKEPQRITQRQLVRMFEDIKRLGNSDDSRFCFLIGAGASKSSGIDTGWELSVRWYNELKEVLDDDVLSSWKKEVEFAEKRIGEFYPRLYRKRYETSQQIGYDEFKKMMENKEPGLGYVILSQILAYEKHNFVITTNFDYLIEDSIKTFTDTKPFVAGHEILAEFITSNSDRPTIIKVHRDLFLHPFNDEKEINSLKTEWANALKPILSRFNLLVIGYGGNDGSLMDYLKNIDSANRKAIYWCIRKGEEPNNKVKKLLTEKDFIVTIDGFDELMYQLYKTLSYKIFDGLDEPNEHSFVKNAKNRISGLSEKIKKLLEDSQKNKELNSIPKEMFKGAFEFLHDAYSENDENKKEEILKKGMELYPNDADLLGAYAMFLVDNRKDYDKAEVYFKKSLEVGPNQAIHLGNYAFFLDEIRKNYDEAEEYYRKSLEIEPNHPNNLSNYAQFLAFFRKNFDKAEEYYKKSLKANPYYAINLRDYAQFLKSFRKNYDKAEEYYKKSLNIDPNNAVTLAFYALFLGSIRKNYDKAEEYFKKSLDVDQNDANNLGNYAHFIILSRKDFSEAEKYIDKAQCLVNAYSFDILAELWFYRFAHYSKWYKQGEKELEKLIANGAKSLGWDFQSHIAIAEENGHPKIEKLKEFAKKLTE